MQNVFVDFYQNFSRESKWSANEVVQFYQNTKGTKIKNSCHPSIYKIVYYFAPLGFGIAEQSDQPIIENKNKRVGGVSVPENGHKSWKIKSIIPDLSEKNYGMYVLTLSQTTNFRLFHTERVCRQQFQVL